MGPMKYLIPLLLTLSSCSVVPKSDDYYLVPEKLTIGFPEWLANVNATYKFQPKEPNDQ